MAQPADSSIFLLSQNVPIEELLGSVTTYNNETKSLQLRQSARVFKKMRLELDSALANATTLSEKRESERKESEKKESEVKKPFRPLWLTEDKDLFFEALNEYGKDFEAIHGYVSGKLRKKGVLDSGIKTREQIRHLYYRTWHKISKHLLFSEDVKKVAQELYGLINYGELRKKLISVSPKTTIRLNELIYRGSITLRVKGKTIRIKTPMCRALRKLNQLDENHDDIKLPTRISVELKPKDMGSWMNVQGMSQNPRIKTTVPLQKRLASLIQCISDRWKTQTILDFERAVSTAKESIDVIDNIPDQNSPGLPPLRFSPPSGVKIHIPTINLSEFFTSHSICLNEYEKRIGVTSPGEQMWLNAFPSFKTSCKKTTKRQRCESNSLTTTSQSPSSKTTTIPTTIAIAENTTSTLQHENNEDNNTASTYCANTVISADVTSESNTRSELANRIDAYIDDAVNTILALQQQCSGSMASDVDMEDKNDKDDKDEDIVEGKIKLEMELDGEDPLVKKEKKEQDIDKIKLGWIVEECGTLSVGDLYLMFGSDSKIELEYSWDTVIPTAAGGDITHHPSSQSLTENMNDLSVTLKRLISVAKLHYRRNMVRCACGHVCNTTTNSGNTATGNVTSKATSGGGGGGPQRGGAGPKCKGRLVKGGSNSSSDVTEELLKMETTNTSTISSTSIVPVPIQPIIKRYMPNSLFRRPNSPNDCLRAQIDSIQRLKPRYSNRKGRRPRNKQVVVERRLPLLANKNNNVDSAHHQQRQIVQMNIISQGNAVSYPAAVTATAIAVNVNNSSSRDAINVDNSCSGDVNVSPPQTLSVSRVCSPTSISNLLEMALNSHHVTGGGDDGVAVMTTHVMTDNVTGDRITEDATSTTITTSTTTTTTTVTSFVGLLPNQGSNSGCSSSPGGATSNSNTTHTPPSSPSRVLKDHHNNDDDDDDNNQWLNSEVADFSFSSFLGHLDSPIKVMTSSSASVTSSSASASAVTGSGGGVGGDDTRLSHDVDAQLHSLLTETSLDYTAKFADLAAQVSGNKNNL